jgi:hypothetical protein
MAYVSTKSDLARVPFDLCIAFGRQCVAGLQSEMAMTFLVQ